jgi:hypothetical protein
VQYSVVQRPGFLAKPCLLSPPSCHLLLSPRTAPPHVVVDVWRVTRSSSRSDRLGKLLRVAWRLSTHSIWTSQVGLMGLWVRIRWELTMARIGRRHGSLICSLSHVDSRLDRISYLLERSVSRPKTLRVDLVGVAPCIYLHCFRSRHRSCRRWFALYPRTSNVVTACY